jgi:hypothetical protein
MTTTIKLLNELATHLSGQVVTVRLQPPAWDFAGGCAWKTMEGSAIVDIDPGTRDPLETFLHEIAHIKYDWRSMTPTDLWKSDPGSLKATDQERAKLRALPREGKAANQVGFWKRYAIENCWRYPGYNVFEKQLNSLMHYSG